MTKSSPGHGLGGKAKGMTPRLPELLSPALGLTVLYLYIYVYIFVLQFDNVLVPHSAFDNKRFLVSPS